ncbi:MAG: hypothetical protein CLLPBCKN_006085 [Chroococcidiopsis cubana SAG 39.79]|nr:hypothetical protein [Chroococcidiopsis cubana SAG 39.79]
MRAVMNCLVLDMTERQLGTGARPVNLSVVNTLIAKCLDYEQKLVLFVGQITVE